MDILIFDEFVVLWPNLIGGRLTLDLITGDDDSPVILFNTPRTDRHRIAGTITVDGIPASRIVVAFDRRIMTYIGGTTSDPVTGKWEITGLEELPERQLLVVAMDTTGNYNAEVADYISQVATATE